MFNKNVLMEDVDQDMELEVAVLEVVVEDVEDAEVAGEDVEVQETTAGKDTTEVVNKDVVLDLVRIVVRMVAEIIVLIIVII